MPKEGIWNVSKKTDLHHKHQQDEQDQLDVTERGALFWG